MTGSPTVRQFEEYGKSGEGHRGIDLLCHRNDGAVEVGQCKCEREFTPAKTRNVAEEFLSTGVLGATERHLLAWGKTKFR